MTLINKAIVKITNCVQTKIGTVILYGVPIVSLMMETKERLCLAQISSTLLKDYSYNVSELDSHVQI